MQDKVEEAVLSGIGLDEPGVVVGAGAPSGLVVQSGLKQQMLSEALVLLNISFVGGAMVDLPVFHVRFVADGLQA